jgi:hypothetical protein
MIPNGRHEDNLKSFSIIKKWINNRLLGALAIIDSLPALIFLSGSH